MFTCESNKFNIKRGCGFVAPVITALATATISFSFNTVVIADGDGVACRFQDMDCREKTVVRCVSNKFESRGCPCIIECARPISLQGSAKFELNMNKLLAYSGSPQVKFGAVMTLSKQAQFLIDSNNMRRGDSLPCDLPFFLFEKQVNLAVGAALSVSQNDCFTKQGSTKVLFLALGASGKISACDTCATNLCNNKFNDAILSSQTSINAALTVGLFNLLRPYWRCSVGNGAASGAAVFAFAAIAAVAALVMV